MKDKKELFVVLLTISLLCFLSWCIIMSFGCKTTDEIDIETKVIMGQLVWCDSFYVLEGYQYYEFYYMNTAQEFTYEKVLKKNTYIVFDEECRLYKKVYVNGRFRCNILWLPYPESVKKKQGV